MVLQLTDRSQRAAGDGWGKRIREELRPRALGQHVAESRRSRDKSASRTAKCFTQGRGDDVHLAQYSIVLGRSPSGRTQNAGAVGIIDRNDCVVLLRQLQDLGEL